jgi:chromate reductase
LVGSLRQSSINHGLLRAIAEMLSDGIHLEYFDLSPIPLFNMDLKARGEPEAVLELKQRIAAADALLIVTPEYNASIPGVLKNAIDWASHPRSQSPLAGKPLAIAGAGGMSGTKHAQRHLGEIAAHLNMPLLPGPALMVNRAWDKFDTQGNLVDANTRRQAEDFVNNLAGWLRCADQPLVSMDVSHPALQPAMINLPGQQINEIR